MWPGIRPIPLFLAAWCSLTVVGGITGSETCQSVAAILFTLLVLPILVLKGMDLATSPPDLGSGATLLLIAPLKFLTVGFGILAIAMGATLCAWILYNSFVETQESYTGPPVFLGLGIAPALMGFGFAIIRGVFEKTPAGTPGVSPEGAGEPETQERRHPATQ